MGINFQRLLDVCRATEELPLGRFDLSTVRCGTAGCMIGNYNAKFLRDPDAFGRGCDDWDFFGITRVEYFWLFGATYRKSLSTDWDNIGLDRVSREQALARLRKFIYYKLRKQEFIVDAKYGVRQEARTKEGNHGFAARAVRETQEAMACV